MLDFRFRLGCFAIALTIATAFPAEAARRIGDVAIAGNFEVQNLIRLDRAFDDQFSAFDPVQQRNTFRLQYDQKVVKRGQLFGDGPRIPGIKSVNFFGYYRFVYDSVFDIRPGPRFREVSGGVAGSFDSFSDKEAQALRFENRIRELYLDVDLSFLPVSFRIGRQQIVFGNTINFRANDNVNALDLSWHLQQEAGLLGSVGFSELRIPEWAIKMLVNTGTVGWFSNTFIEAYDMPFNFEPTRVAFYPRPWGVPVRNPFRPGLVIDVSEALGAPLPGLLLVQPCFDTTGNPDANAAASPDFSESAETGMCPSSGLEQSRIGAGLYDRHDPMDVNTFGARVGGTFRPLQLGFSLSYKHGRHLAGSTGGGVSKVQVGALNANQPAYIQPAPHESTDPLTGETNNFIGFIRVPLEFYYPYVHTFGLALDYYSEWLAGVWNVEVAANKGVPISTIDPTGNGLNRKWELETSLLVDRPTWIRALNRRSTFNVLFQTNASILPGHDALTFAEDGTPITGDVGVPNSTLIPGQFGEVTRLDERHQFEVLSLLVMQTFYRGGSISPLVVFISDWTNAPAFELQAFFQYLPTPNLILEPGVRIFWTNGRIVDDRYQVTKNAGRSELQLKATWQF